MILIKITWKTTAAAVLSPNNSLRTHGSPNNSLRANKPVNSVLRKEHLVGCLCFMVYQPL